MRNKSDADLPVCGAEGCSVSSPAVPSSEARSAKHQAFELQVVSDVICPWCYVGKRHMEQALGELRAEGVSLSVRWLPYELNPGMPQEGVERNEYRTRKFGSLERSQALDAQVASAGKAAGLEFRHALMKRTPNTFDAHRLIWLADREGVQDAVENLFKAYFTDGRDVGDSEVLIDIGADSGLDRDRVRSFLHSTEGTPEVRREIAAAQAAGMQGVPTFVLAGQVLFSGAQPANVMTAILRSVIEAASHAAPVE